MSKKHWLVTARLDGGDDQTYYVLGLSATHAERTTKAHVRYDAEGKKIPLDEVYVTMIAELPGPPLRVYNEWYVQDNPEPINPPK